MATLRPSAIAARARSLRAATAPAGTEREPAGTEAGTGKDAGLGPEVYEVAARDGDRGGA